MNKYYQPQGLFYEIHYANVLNILLQFLERYYKVDTNEYRNHNKHNYIEVVSQYDFFFY